jgi:uncharacterized SAM-binding protein YcdF (DUF218 family)
MSPSGETGSRWDPIWLLKIRPVRVLAVLLLLAASAALLVPSILTAHARWLIEVDPPVHAEIAVVLGGGEGERLGAALRIWKEGRVPAILITGPATPLLRVYTGEDSLTQGEAKRRIAVRKGVPDSSVYLALGPTSTYEEAVTVRGFLEERKIRRAIVVTSPFHSRRARRTFLHIFRDSPVEITLETLPLDLSYHRPEQWWTREHDMMTVFTETLKTLFYWNRYSVRPF